MISLADKRHYHYAPEYFSFARVILGLYLFEHFLALTKHAPEIFSYAGLLPNPSLNPTYPLFFNILYLFDSPVFVTSFVWILAGLSLALLVGYKRRFVSFLLWYGFACLFNRNNLIGNPSIPFVGLLLLALCVIPSGESYSLDARQNPPDYEWEFPQLLFSGLFFIMALSYTVSGLHKLTSPSWRDGQALYFLFSNPLARNYFLPEMMQKAPMFLLKGLSYSSIFLEILFLPLCLVPKWRLPTVSLMIAMHLGIATLVNFFDLTAGMLVFHLFMIDPRWLTRTNPVRGTVFFDGVCNLCNSFVSFLIRQDHKRCLRFASLQSSAKEMLPPEYQDLKTVVFVHGTRISSKTKAIAHILENIGGHYRLLSLALQILPTSLTNVGYDFVATNRYRWFGKKETCRLPTSEERAQFI